MYDLVARGQDTDKDFYLRFVRRATKKTLVGFKRSLIADYEN
jgi:hypothetical protein